MSTPTSAFTEVSYLAGIGGYDLSSTADIVFPFDYTSSGKSDHLVLYRPGTGAISILHNDNSSFTPVYEESDWGNGIGGYNLSSSADRAFAFDYDSSGKLDHLALYRPGTGTFWILSNNHGVFSPVYHEGDPGNSSNGSGIGGYDLLVTADIAFAFDYDSSGKSDHLVLYRPGAGTIYILRNNGGTFVSVYAEEGNPGNGIGGYDLQAQADRAFAFDYDSSGKLDYLALYRPGTGIFWILRHHSGAFFPIYHNFAVGEYNLLSPTDNAFAFDYDGSGKLDHLVLYRPGRGAIFIISNDDDFFAPVYVQGDPGYGIGGYDLSSTADRAFAFDYDGNGKLDHLVFYRPGTGTISLLKNANLSSSPPLTSVPLKKGNHIVLAVAIGVGVGLLIMCILAIGLIYRNMKRARARRANIPATTASHHSMSSPGTAVRGTAPAEINNHNLSPFISFFPSRSPRERKAMRQMHERPDGSQSEAPLFSYNAPNGGAQDDERTHEVIEQSSTRRANPGEQDLEGPSDIVAPPAYVSVIADEGR